MTVDGSGNKHGKDVGVEVKKLLADEIKKQHNFTVNIKYIDPTYAIRSVAANPSDTVMCAKLAQNAVHGAMAGYTAFTTGIVNNAVTWIPIQTINDAGCNTINVTFSRTW